MILHRLTLILKLQCQSRTGCKHTGLVLLQNCTKMLQNMCFYEVFEFQFALKIKPRLQKNTLLIFPSPPRTQKRANKKILMKKNKTGATKLRFGRVVNHKI